MYLKNIAIKNIGPIEKLSIDLPFKENGDPKPIIFVGENGTGKTILLSQIIDGLYEIGSPLFEDIGVHNGLKRSYYKISGNINLRSGKDKGFSILKFIYNQNGYIEYFDKVGEIKKEDFIGCINDFTLNPNDSKSIEKETTSLDDIQKEKLKSDLIQGVHFYQPAYRYEEPFWKNDCFIGYTKFEEKKKFSDRLDKELEIISSTKENKTFLLDLVLDNLVQKANPIDQVLWQNINIILRQVLRRNNYRFGVGPRGGYRVSIVEDKNNNIEVIMPSIDNLSLGESILLNLFINIARHNGDHQKQLGEIQGIVVIDEIDVHLHTELQRSVLPELINIFKKIQFIITTHSPIFLLGMKNTFGEKEFEIRNMPTGELITAERFSEFESAYDVLKETEKFEKDLKAKIISNNKPIIYVEGPTDVQYIEKAYEIYGKNHDDFQIEIIGERTQTGTKNSNNKALSNAKKVLSTNLNLLSQKVILLNDPEVDVEEINYNDLLYIKRIPKFDQNPLQKGIENLFNREFIDRAKESNLNCFHHHVIGIEERDHGIIDGQKQVVCDWICQNGTKDDFKNFETIFQIIESAVNTESEGDKIQA